MTKAIILHLSLMVVGWGIVTALGPRASPPAPGGDEAAALPGKKSVRARPDIAGGKRLLERLAREMDPPAPREPSPYASLSLDEKADYLIAELNPNATEPPSAEVREQFRRRAILGLIGGIVHGSNGPDYSYAFRHGRMEAEEILDVVAAALPEHAADPYFPVMLYHCLVRQDPRRAEPLLAGLPDRERARVHDSLLSGREPILSPPAPPKDVAPRGDGSLYLAENPIPAPDPDFAFALLACAPMERERYRQYDRGWVWRTCAREFAGSYRDDYVGWIKTLPPGPERDVIEQSLPPADLLLHPPAGIFDTPGTR
jgi:hypothetical protein